MLVASVDLTPVTAGMPGTSELIVILIIILVIFGGASLPKLFGSIGKSIREFKKAVREPDETSGDKEGSGKPEPPA